MINCFPTLNFLKCFTALASKPTNDDENADLHFFQPLADVERAADTFDGAGGGGQAGWQTEGAQHHRYIHSHRRSGFI